MGVLGILGEYCGYWGWGAISDTEGDNRDTGMGSMRT